MHRNGVLQAPQREHAALYGLFPVGRRGTIAWRSLVVIITGQPSLEIYSIIQHSELKHLRDYTQ